MMRAISESDWKVFRQVREIALDRFCDRVLSEIMQLAADTGKSNHHRYLTIYKRIHKRDSELANAFNDLRRSTAHQQLAYIYSLKLLTEDELSRFSEETRDILRFFTGS